MKILRNSFNFKYLTLIGAMTIVLLPIFLFFLNVYNYDFELNGEFIKKNIYISVLQGIFVCIIATSIGVFMAFYETFFINKHKYLHKFVILAPLAFPSFIFGVIYTDIFDKFSMFVINNFDFNSKFVYQFFDIATLGGTIFVLSCIFYPYAYMSTLMGLKSVSKYFFDNGAVYGYKNTDIILKVVLRLILPSVCVGALLIIMEVVNDFGVSYYFGVETISVGIFNIWNSSKSFSIIVQIVGFILLFSIAMIYFVSRFDKTKQQISSHNIINEKINLSIKIWQKNLLKYLYYFIILICFVIPFSYTFFMGLKYMGTSLNTEFLIMVIETIIVCGIIAFLICFASFLVSYCNRDLKDKKFVKFSYPIITSGYAISGIVVGLCVLVTSIYIDDLFYNIFNSFKQGIYSKTIDYTFFALAIAYLIKYWKVGVVNISSSMSMYSYNLDDMVKIMGIKPIDKLKSIIYPMSKGGIFISIIIIFIELIKELPIMLLLKPVGFETIATYIYQYYSDELFEYAYFGSLCIVLISLIPIYILFFDKNK